MAYASLRAARISRLANNAMPAREDSVARTVIPFDIWE
jgi:hypothetical protein